jgi:hypothetical protein
LSVTLGGGLHLPISAQPSTVTYDAPDRGARATGGVRPALVRRMGAPLPLFIAALSG